MKSDNFKILKVVPNKSQEITNKDNVSIIQSIIKRDVLHLGLILSEAELKELMYRKNSKKTLEMQKNIELSLQDQPLVNKLIKQILSSNVRESAKTEFLEKVQNAMDIQNQNAVDIQKLLLLPNIIVESTKQFVSEVNKRIPEIHEESLNLLQSKSWLKNFEQQDKAPVATNFKKWSTNKQIEQEVLISGIQTLEDASKVVEGCFTYNNKHIVEFCKHQANTIIFSENSQAEFNEYKKKIINSQKAPWYSLSRIKLALSNKTQVVESIDMALKEFEKRIESSHHDTLSTADAPDLITDAFTLRNEITKAIKFNRPIALTQEVLEASSPHTDISITRSPFPGKSPQEIEGRY